jgi:hypothetical protein
MESLFLHRAPFDLADGGGIRRAGNERQFQGQSAERIKKCQKPAGNLCFSVLLETIAAS